MTPDKYDVLGPALNRIGQKIADIIGAAPDGAFLYVRIGEGSVGPSLFRDEGNRVRYFPSLDHGIADLLFDLWEAESPDIDKRWGTMEYEIKGSSFSVSFKYREEVDPDEDFQDRRERILRARYGDKPIDYPTLPSGDGWDLEP